MCGHDNPENATVCANCKTPIPRMSHMVSSSPPAQVHDRSLQIKDASDKVLAGQWTIDEYAKYLHDLREVLSQKEREIREVEIPEESMEEFAEELTVGYHGIDLYNEGISYLMKYTEDGNPINVTHGMQLIYEGNEKINDAMRINRENKKKIEEYYMDLDNMMEYE